MTQHRTASNDSPERLWTYDAVRVGQAGNPTRVTLAPADIAEYAACAQNPDPRYARPGPDAGDGNGNGSGSGAGGHGGAPMPAMPTMALAYAPLLREDIAAANGFVAQERSRAARRQTPFAKCEIRWYRPVRAGETLAGERRVHQKYERRGSKFVTFRVSAFDQAGAVVARYDYTCIFEYAGGQRAVPEAAESAAGSPDAGAIPDPARFLTWEQAVVGTPLPRDLAVTETTDNILRKKRPAACRRTQPQQHSHRRGIRPAEHIRRRRERRPRYDGLCGPFPGPQLSAGSPLQRRQSGDARHYAIPGRRPGHLFRRRHRRRRQPLWAAPGAVPHPRRQPARRTGLPLRRHAYDGITGHSI